MILADESPFALENVEEGSVEDLGDPMSKEEGRRAGRIEKAGGYGDNEVGIGEAALKKIEYHESGKSKVKSAWLFGNEREKGICRRCALSKDRKFIERVGIGAAGFAEMMGKDAFTSTAITEWQRGKKEGREAGRTEDFMDAIRERRVASLAIGGE
jgi:hypothetical protein